MALKNEYQNVARRSLDASDATLRRGVHELAAFLTYHAFESTGSALAESLNVIPKTRKRSKIYHNEKISYFLKAAQRFKGGSSYSSEAEKISRVAFSIANARECLFISY